MNSRFKRFATIVIALGLAMPAAAFSFEKEPAIKGSISTKGLAKSEYSKHAKISASIASQIAIRHRTGSVVSTSLENEDGSLIYAVDVSSGPNVEEILIDAGNGKILAHHKDESSDTENDTESED